MTYEQQIELWSERLLKYMRPLGPNNRDRFSFAKVQVRATEMRGHYVCLFPQKTLKSQPVHVYWVEDREADEIVLAVVEGITTEIRGLDLGLSDAQLVLRPDDEDWYQRLVAWCMMTGLPHTPRDEWSDSWDN